jgi:holo-[acyl-carrier protein] synthase
VEVGVGIDIVDVADFEESVSRFGDAYLRRVFTRREVAACGNGAEARGLAARFAAKEATLKTLGHDDALALDWRSIEILPEADGAPGVALSGAAADLAAKLGMVSFALSVSTNDRHALAVVIASSETDERAGA